MSIELRAWSGYFRCMTRPTHPSHFPAIRTLLAWGDEHYSDQGPRRLFRHAADDGLVSPAGVCAACGLEVPVGDLMIVPGPGLGSPAPADPVSQALATPHPMLEPLHA